MYYAISSLLEGIVSIALLVFYIWSLGAADSDGHKLMYGNMREHYYKGENAVFCKPIDGNPAMCEVDQSWTGMAYDMSCTASNIQALEITAFIDVIIHISHTIVLLIVVLPMAFFSNLPTEQLLKTRHSNAGCCSNFFRKIVAVLLKTGPLLHWIFVLCLLMVNGVKIFLWKTHHCEGSTIDWSFCRKHPDSGRPSGYCMYNQIKNCIYYAVNIKQVNFENANDAINDGVLCPAYHEGIKTSYLSHFGGEDIRACHQFYAYKWPNDHQNWVEPFPKIRDGWHKLDLEKNLSSTAEETVCKRIAILRAIKQIKDESSGGKGDQFFRSHYDTEGNQGHCTFLTWNVFKEIGSEKFRKEFHCFKKKSQLVLKPSDNTEKRDTHWLSKTNGNYQKMRDRFNITQADDKNFIYNQTVYDFYHEQDKNQSCNTYVAYRKIDNEKIVGLVRPEGCKNGRKSGMFFIHQFMWMISISLTGFLVLFGQFVRLHTRHELFYVNPGKENFEFKWGTPFLNIYYIARRLSP